MAYSCVKKGKKGMESIDDFDVMGREARKEAYRAQKRREAMGEGDAKIADYFGAMNRKIRAGKARVLRTLQTGRVAIASIMMVALVLPSGIGLATSIMDDGAFLEQKASAEPEGEIKRIIVKFNNVESVSANSGNITMQQAIIERFGEQLDESMDFQEGYKKLVRTYTNLPMAVFEVDARGEESLRNDVNVESVMEDRPMVKDALTSQIETVGGDPTLGFSDGTNYYDGSGYAVVIIDDGVDKSHPSLSGKVIAEACFGMNQAYTDATLSSLCPGSAEEYTGSGAASNACGTADACTHGTMVAGASSMGTVTLNGIDGQALTTSGVAAGSNIIAVQVNALVTPVGLANQQLYCGGATSCTVPMTSLILAGYDYAIQTAFASPVAALNNSNGSGLYADVASCQADENYAFFKNANDALIAANIAPVVANGNSGHLPGNAGKISAPACVQGSVAVGATNMRGTAIASYSNNGPLTTLIAPGGDYDGTESSIMWLPAANTGGSFGGTQGTSFAAPMVAGAFAVLRGKFPSASVSELVTLMQDTSEPVVDSRAGYNNIVMPLIQLDAALAGEIGTIPPVGPENPSAGFVDENGNSADPIHIVGSGSSIIFQVEKDFGFFVDGGSVLVNGQSISGDKYVASSGSTIIALNSAYLDSLAIGAHTLAVQFNDGTSASGMFMVQGGNSGGGGGNTDSGFGAPDAGFIGPVAQKRNATIATASKVSMIVAGICVVLLGLSFMKGNRKLRELRK